MKTPENFARECNDITWGITLVDHVVRESDDHRVNSQTSTERCSIFKRKAYMDSFVIEAVVVYFLSADSLTKQC